MKYTEQEYIDCDPFSDEAELTCRAVSLRKANKEHSCYGIGGENDHVINKGELYRYEKALVDGEFFGEYKLCLSCLDKYIEMDY